MTLQFALPFALIGAFLQAAVIAPYWPTLGRPDLVPVIVLLWAAFDRGEEGLVWAFIGGFFLDIFSGMPLGVSSALLTLIALVMGRLETRVYRANITFLLITIALGLLVFHLGQIVALIFLEGQSFALSATLLNITLPSLLFNVILTVPLTRLLGDLYERTHPRGVKI